MSSDAIITILVVLGQRKKRKAVSGMILGKSNPSLERDQKTSWLFSGNLGLLLTHITYIEETRDSKWDVTIL